MPTPSTDYLPPALERWRTTAATVLDEHTNQDGRCAACGDPWPCTRARLADVALAALQGREQSCSGQQVRRFSTGS